MKKRITTFFLLAAITLYTLPPINLLAAKGTVIAEETVPDFELSESEDTELSTDANELKSVTETKLNFQPDSRQDRVDTNNKNNKYKVTMDESESSLGKFGGYVQVPRGHRGTLLYVAIIDGVEYIREGSLLLTEGDWPFYVTFPIQEEGKEIEIVVRDTRGSNLSSQTFSLNDSLIKINIEEFTDWDDFMEINFDFKSKNLSNDFTRADKNLIVQIGNDEFVWENYLWKYDCSYSNGKMRLNLNKRYPAGTKVQISLSMTDEKYPGMNGITYNGTVKKKTGDFCTLTCNILLDSDFTFLIHIKNINYISKKKIEPDNYQVTLKIGGDIYSAHLKASYDSETDFLFDLVKQYPSGTEYEIIIFNENYNATSKYVNKVGHDAIYASRYDNAYSIISPTLFNDQKSVKVSLDCILEGDYFTEVYSMNELITVCLEIGGDRYYSHKFYEDWIYFDWRTPFAFKLKKYYKQGTTYTITVTGQETGSTVVLKKQVAQSKKKPKIKLNRITSHSKSISGVTEPSATVSIKLGRKKYITTANKKGDFKVRIKQCKVGTKCQITVKSKVTGNGSKISAKVKKPSISIDILTYLTRGHCNVSGEIRGAKKSDYIMARINGRNYKGKINFKKNTFNIQVPSLSVGKLKIVVYNKYRQPIKTHWERIYSSANIYIGMSATDLRQSIYGIPDRVYYSGNLEEWLYYNNGSYIYVYLQNGRVYWHDDI